MELAVLLPIAAFIALAAGLIVVLQRTGRIVARTRELEVFKTNVIDLASRVDSSLGGAASQIDALRRRQLAPDAIAETLEAATDAVERYANEARALRGPRETNRLRNDIIGELERAEPSARDRRARHDDASQQPAAGARGRDVDQARVPQPAARPRGDRAPRRRRRRSSPDARRHEPVALTPSPHHLVVSSADTTTPSGARRQESHALPPMW